MVHSHVKAVDCPYCKKLADVGRDAIKCRSCGAYAVHEGSNLYKWHERVGMLGQITRYYKW